MCKRLLSLLLILALGQCALLPALAEDASAAALYIIPDSSSRELTAQELWGYTRETLDYISNEILARHGYAFHNMEYFRYFDAKPWYHAGGYAGLATLSLVELRNFALIRAVKNAMCAAGTENEGGVSIASLLDWQNAMGGYGNQISFGNAYGNNEGLTYAEAENPNTAQQALNSKLVSATPYYIYNADYIIPDSNTRLLTEGELWAYSREALRYIRNEILARYCYIYGDNKFGRYFMTKSWYHEGGYNDNKVSYLEWQNINLIREVEGAMDKLGTENPTGLDITAIIANQNNGTYPGK